MTHWYCRPSVVLSMGLARRLARPLRTRAATPEQVDSAITQAKKYIYSQMKKDNWETVPKPKPDGSQQDPSGKQWGGTTALAVYGLSRGRREPAGREDQAGHRVAEELRRWDEDLAVDSCAEGGTFLKNEKDAKLASTPDFNILLNSLLSDEKRIGLYAYYVDLATGKPQKDWWGNSVSQYGVLGVWASDRPGTRCRRSTGTSWTRR